MSSSFFANVNAFVRHKHVDNFQVEHFKGDLNGQFRVIGKDACLLSQEKEPDQRSREDMRIAGPLFRRHS